MVFALCDEEDFLGLLQSAVQLMVERRDEEKGNWKREIGEMEGGESLQRKLQTFSEKTEARDVQRIGRTVKDRNILHKS